MYGGVFMNIYIKRAIIIFIIMSVVVTYLTIFLYKRSVKTSLTYPQMPIIVIDAGHGEPDGGATSIDGTKESDINLEIAKKVSAILSGKCYNVVMTRQTSDGIGDITSDIRSWKRSDMQKREELAGSGDIFISIHLNSFSQKSVHGAQVFFSPNNENSKLLGEAIRAELIKVSARNDRILKKADSSIYLMNKVKAPACLIECAFLSNDEDLSLIKSEDYQMKIANAIVCGIECYQKEKL